MQIIELKNVIIKELGPSTITTSDSATETKYSYIDFQDGNSFKSVIVPHILKDILLSSLNENIVTDIYLIKEKKTLTLFAAKKSDGRNFAVLPVKFSIGLWFLMIMSATFGAWALSEKIYLIAFFGLAFGLILFSGFIETQKLKTFVKKLPDNHISSE